MGNKFITSDHHWGHSAMIRMEDRPFSSTDEMDEAMIDAWNSVVKKADHVIHAGDLVMRRQDADRILSRLNGTITLIIGNHDKFVGHLMKNNLVQKVLESRIFSDGGGFMVSHRPQTLSSMFHVSVSVHGHTHSRDPHPEYFPGAQHVNVCVDRIGYVPMAWEDLVTKVAAANERAEPCHRKRYASSEAAL